MADRKPNEPTPRDFTESAKRSEDANIADESAAYTNAADDEAEGSGAATEGSHHG